LSRRSTDVEPCAAPGDRRALPRAAALPATAGAHQDGQRAARHPRA
jgi:hypothetical protein